GVRPQRAVPRDGTRRRTRLEPGSHRRKRQRRLRRQPRRPGRRRGPLDPHRSRPKRRLRAVHALEPGRVTNVLRRPRFSLRLLFGVTTLLAVGIGFWLAYIYEPPTHKIPLYEKAPSTRGTSIRVGPNTIRLRSITRNRYDGTLEAW